MDMIQKIVEILIEKGQTIATMESCTGGALANTITNISGASMVLKRSYITYSNDAKIDLGVNKDTIEKYSVYSKEVAMEMAKNASLLAKSSYGVGITGQIGRIDPNNLGGSLNKIDVSIYNSLSNQYTNLSSLVKSTKSRKDCKEQIVNETLSKILDIITK